MNATEKNQTQGNTHHACDGSEPLNMVITGGVAKTLNAVKCDSDHVPCVLVYESHGQDCRYKYLGDVCSTVSQKYGTGGAMLR